MDVFTSSEEELNKADIQRKSAEFTGSASVRFSAKLDSKGRVTVPARIRNRLDLEKGDQISLQLDSRKVVQEEVSDYQEALRFVSQFDSISSFSFEDGVVEVVLSGR